MPTILNILPPLPAKGNTLADINAAVDAAVKQAHAGRAKGRKADDGWRQEFEELERRFKNMLPLGQAEAALARVKAQVKAATDEIEAQIGECVKSLKTPYLSRLEETHVRERKAKLADKLADLQSQSRVPLAQAEAAVRTAKEWEPKRERYQELKRRADAIDKAIKI